MPASATIHRSARSAGDRFLYLAALSLRHHQDLVLGFSHRLRKPDGSFGGIVLAILNLSRIEDFFAALDIGKDGNVTLWDGTASRVLARYPVNASLLGRGFEQGRSTSSSDGRTEEPSSPSRPSTASTGCSASAASPACPGDIGRPGRGRRSGGMAPRTLDLRHRIHVRRCHPAVVDRRALVAADPAGRLVDAVSASEAAMRQTNQSLRTAIVAAEAASRTKSEFLACMSHELRTRSMPSSASPS